jgi:hypothetical protein
MGPRREIRNRNEWPLFFSVRGVGTDTDRERLDDLERALSVLLSYCDDLIRVVLKL